MQTAVKHALFIITIGILIGLLIGGLIWVTSSQPRGNPITLQPRPTQRDITIYITGKVQNPGVYKLPPGSRIDDAVKMAGGFLADADTTSINMAALLEDSSQITVKQISINASLMDAKVNINIATSRELETLPGIGSTAAGNIVDYRRIHGPFLFVEDIQKVTGIGPATFERIKDLISVGD